MEWAANGPIADSQNCAPLSVVAMPNLSPQKRTFLSPIPAERDERLLIHNFRPLRPKTGSLELPGEIGPNPINRTIGKQALNSALFRLREAGVRQRCASFPELGDEAPCR